MRRQRPSTTSWALAVAPVLALTAACSSAGTAGSAGPTSGPATGTAATPGGTDGPTGEAAGTASAQVETPVVLLLDELDDDTQGWGGELTTFVDGAYVWTTTGGESGSRSPDSLIAVGEQIDQQRTTVDLVSSGVMGVGVDCAYEEADGTSRWYSLELTTDGAVIRRRPFGDDPVTTLASSADDVLREGPLTLEATCLLLEDTYVLSLAVDGTVVVSAEDPEPFGSGAPGLLVRGSPDGPGEVRFERFEVRVPQGGPEPLADEGG